MLLAGWCFLTAAIFHTKFSDPDQLSNVWKNMTMAGGFSLVARSYTSSSSVRIFGLTVIPHEPFRNAPRAGLCAMSTRTQTAAFERSRRYRKSVEMLFAHFKRILRLGRLRLRGPCGAQDESTLAAIAQKSRLTPRP